MCNELDRDGWLKQSHSYPEMLIHKGFLETVLSPMGEVDQKSKGEERVTLGKGVMKTADRDLLQWFEAVFSKTKASLQNRYNQWEMKMYCSQG